MSHRSIGFLVILFVILASTYLFLKINAGVTYKCQANMSITILHSDVSVKANITQIYNNKTLHIPYTVIGSLRKGDDEYILFRDGDVKLSEDKIMRKIINENINPSDNVENNLWEDNFLVRKLNVEYYQSETEIGEQLLFIKALSGPIMVCVKSQL